MPSCRFYIRSVLWVIALAWGCPLYGQLGPLSIGLKLGVPVSDAFDSSALQTCSNPAFCYLLNYSSKTKRFTGGPAVEWKLPHGLAFELDALYTRLNYDSYSYNATFNLGISFASASTTADRWEFPLLVKWRYSRQRMSPFIDGGPVLDDISNVESLGGILLVSLAESTKRPTVHLNLPAPPAKDLWPVEGSSYVRFGRSI